MIDPMMNASPARKNIRSTTSTAATMFSMKPVSEIVFGVSRDSISASRISSCVVGPSRPVRERRRAPERGGVSAVIRRSGGGGAEVPDIRARPGQQPVAEHPGRRGRDAAEEHVGQVVVTGRDDDERDQQRGKGPQ